MKKLISVVLALAMIFSLAAGVCAYEAPAGIDSLAIVGEIPGLNTWDPSDANGDMELVADYVYVKEVALTAGSSMKFKVAGNDMWDDACNFGTNGAQVLTLGTVTEMVCHGGSSDMTVNADKDMTVKITVDLTAFVNGGAATILVEEVVADAAGEVVISDNVYVDDVWSGAGPYSWTATSNGTLTVTFNEAACSESWAYGVEGMYGMDIYWSDTIENGATFNVAAGDTFTMIVFAYDGSMDFVKGTVDFEVTFVSTGEGGDVVTPVGPGSSENDPIIFSDDSYVASVPAGATVWFAFDDYNDFWNNGVFAQQFSIMGNTGYTVTYAYGSEIVDDDLGVVEGEAFCNMQGKYLFSITNNNAGDENYIISFSDITPDEGGDSDGTHFVLTDGIYQNITVPVGGTVTVEVDATMNDMVLYVSGQWMYYDWYLDNGMQMFYPNMWGDYELKLPAGSVYTLTLGNFSEESAQELSVVANVSLPGSYENPEELVIGGENIGSFDAFGGYYFCWTAPEDGEFTITVDTSISTDWYYGINSDNAAYYGDFHYSTDEVPVPSETVSVKAGDVYIIAVGSASWEAGSVGLIASFVPGESGDEPGGDKEDKPVIGDGNFSVTDAPATDAEPLTYTFVIDTTGVLNIQIGNCNPGWRYKIVTPDGVESLYKNNFNTGVDANFELTQLGEYTIKVYAYDPVGFVNVDGTVSCDITFTPGEIGGEVEKEEYIVSDVVLGEGDNILTLDENAITTIYEFAPTANGIYTFTVENADALVGYWGAFSHFLTKPDGELSNVLIFEVKEGKLNRIEPTDDYGNVIEEDVYEEWNCPSVMVGISGVEGEFVLNIEKTGDVVIEEEIPYEDYEPEFDFNYEIPEGEIVEIDLFDDKDDVAVLGKDGFYHYGSANGPLMVADLSDFSVDIMGAYGYGQLRYVLRDENGKAISKIDYNEAMYRYYRAGLVPVTAELAEMIQNIGTTQGWWLAGGFVFDEAPADVSISWMSACSYVEGTETPEEPVDPEIPETGDNSIAGLIVAMMAATAGAVIISKKKEF